MSVTPGSAAEFVGRFATLCCGPGNVAHQRAYYVHSAEERLRRGVREHATAAFCPDCNYLVWAYADGGMLHIRTAQS